MNKLLFLSHIHEESELARIIKTEIENEFSGFVDVFVSSDGSSIPAGSNFLKRIENGLLECVGALYLISPVSIIKNWINFELGAVWLRNVANTKNNLPEIPTIPICHSGMILSDLPAPINNLNAIIGNQSSQLEFAFKSIQNSVGGKGNLKTDFDKLVQDILVFEKKYTLGENVIKLLKIIQITKNDIDKLIDHCSKIQSGNKTSLNLQFTQTEIIKKLKEFEANELKGLILIKTSNSGLAFSQFGAINGAQTEIEFVVDIINDFKQLIISRF